MIFWDFFNFFSEFCFGKIFAGRPEKTETGHFRTGGILCRIPYKFAATAVMAETFCLNEAGRYVIINNKKQP